MGMQSVCLCFPKGRVWAPGSLGGTRACMGRGWGRVGGEDDEATPPPTIFTPVLLRGPLAAA